MARSCTFRVIKIFVVVFTLIIMGIVFNASESAQILGAALLAISIYLYVGNGYLSEEVSGFEASTIVFIGMGAGAGMFVISLIGLVGSLTKSCGTLVFFLILLFLTSGLEIGAGITGFIWKDNIQDELHNDMKKTINKYGTVSEGVTKAWDWAQQKFECCGVDNSSDWILSNTAFNTKGHHKFVPDSCCKDEKKGCGNLITRGKDEFKKKIYQKGCLSKLKTFIKNHLLTIGLSAFSILSVELIVIVLTIVFVKRLGRAISKPV